MGFVFKADERWSTDDDRAMEEALARELDPDLARDSVSLWVHARSSVFVMLGIATVLPAALLTIAVPWLAALLVALALLAAACLFARIRVDRSGLRVFAAGFVRVMDVPAAAIEAATPKEVKAADYGGWGYRSRGTATALLVSSGPGRRRRPLRRADPDRQRRQRHDGGQRRAGALAGGGTGPPDRRRRRFVKAAMPAGRGRRPAALVGWEQPPTRTSSPRDRTGLPN